MSSNSSRPPLHPPNEIDIVIEGIAVRALVDTGAVVSVISEKLCRSLRKVTTPLTNLALRTATSHYITPSAQCTARVVIQDVRYAVKFVVLPRSSYDVILGWDFLSTHQALVDCARAELTLSNPCPDLDDRSPPKVFAAADVHIVPLSAVLVRVFSPAATILFCFNHL